MDVTNVGIIIGVTQAIKVVVDQFFGQKVEKVVTLVVAVIIGLALGFTKGQTIMQSLVDVGVAVGGTTLATKAGGN